MPRLTESSREGVTRANNLHGVRYGLDSLDALIRVIEAGGDVLGAEIDLLRKRIATLVDAEQERLLRAYTCESPESSSPPWSHWPLTRTSSLVRRR
jgi:hypothetical protein